MSTAPPYPPQDPPPFPIVTGRVRIAVDDPDATGTGGFMDAYTARPAEPGVRPAVIVGFEMFGVTAYIRRVADRLAAMGCLAVVPDFHHRTAPGFEGTADDAGRAAGFALLQRLTRDGVLRDVRATVDHLRGLPDAGERIGMVGFSLGGHLAFYAATRIDLAATAVVYPGWLDVTGTALGTPQPLLDLVPGMAGHRGKLLYLMGGKDHVVTPEQNRLAGERLTAAGVRHEVVVYRDGPHGFLADERDSYRPDLAADAWRRITDLLAAELDPSVRRIPDPSTGRTADPEAAPAEALSGPENPGKGALT
ncbi:dienelactone hydrolase family protein [Actinacidiphila alni]|uniref:dienelactone hydrolase family protein n=1 Tax=Actinacidiphila alni TaxID=380248 RepID=UPI003456C83F